MPVTEVRKDREALRMEIVAEFDAPIDRIWRMWDDPRQLERWWGPPTHPATFVEHELAPGGAASYYMTGPDGERYHGWWRIRSVDAPNRLEFEDGFADDDGEPAADMPTTITRVRLEDRAGGGTSMTIESVFPSLEAMEEVLAMGAEEGLKAALGQIDEILDEEKTSA